MAVHEFYKTTQTITHDTSTTQYTAKDIISAGTTVPMVFNCNNNGGIIKKVLIKTNVAAFVGAVRLWFYTGTAPTFAADNAAMAMLYTEGYLGYAEVTLESWGANSSIGQAVCDLAFDRVSSISAVLTANSTPTPANGMIFTVTVITESY